MAQLVLLVVAAAWAAVLVPPMLRSRVDNHPDSSVSDFRRQLSTLQSTSTPARSSLLGMGRPLAQSPLQRPAAAGRPGHAMHRQASLHSAGHGAQVAPGARQAQRTMVTPGGQQFRSHGDPSGGQPRPAANSPVRPTGAHPRQTRVTMPDDPRSVVRRRRSNVLFLLVVVTSCSMFLAATTGSDVLLYVFALAFLALCGYVYLLAQLRQREQTGWNDGWLDHR